MHVHARLKSIQIPDATDAAWADGLCDDAGLESLVARRIAAEE